MRSPHLRPPLQSRSQETLNRILDAAALLLETRSFEELTLTDVVAKAGCSVGAFYGRFRDKEALLHALDERYFGEFAAVMTAALDSEIFERGSLPEVLQHLADVLLHFHTRQRGLLRALILHARIHRDPAFQSREQKLWKLIPRLVAALSRFRDDLAHPDPERAIVFAFLQMLYSLREMVLWPRIARHTPVKGDALARELARACHAYLVTSPKKKIRTNRR